MRTVKIVKVETPELLVKAIETTEDLEELMVLLKEGYLILGKKSFTGLFIAEDGQSLKYKTYRSAYGDSVDEFTRTLVRIGQFLITNQKNDGEIISNAAQVPSRLLEHVVI